MLFQFIKKVTSNRFRNLIPISFQLIFNSLFKYFKNINLSSPNFFLVNSWVHQLYLDCTSISSFDANTLPEVTDIFLDMLKAIDRIWNAFLFKLECLGPASKYYGLVKSFFSNITGIRVVAKGWSSGRSSPAGQLSHRNQLWVLSFCQHIVNDLPLLWITLQSQTFHE